VVSCTELRLHTERAIVAMNQSPQKQQRPDVKHSLLGLLFVFSCLLMNGCSDDDPVSQAHQDVGARLLPGGGNYMHAKVHFKPPRTGPVKFTIMYSLENAVCKIEDNGHQKLRLSWFEEYEHKVPKSTFRLRAIAGSQKLENACFGEETSGELECLAAAPSGNDSVVYSTEEMLEPAFQWASPVVSEATCPGSGLPGWAPWVIGIGGCVCCSWSAMLLNCLFKAHGVPEKYPLFWTVWRCPVKTGRWLDDRLGSRGKGGNSSSSGGGGGCGGGGGGCGGGG